MGRYSCPCCASDVPPQFNPIATRRLNPACSNQLTRQRRACPRCGVWLERTALDAWTVIETASLGDARRQLLFVEDDTMAELRRGQRELVLAAS